MKRILSLLAAFLLAAQPVLAADRKPIVIGSTGQQQQIQSSDTLSMPALKVTAGTADIQADVRFSADISPSQITANQNDYNPTGLSTAAVLRLSTDASRNVTGLQGGADGRVIVVANVGSNNLVLKDESASSSAANRFALDADLTLGADTAATLVYDATSSRWRAVAVGKASTGGSGTVTTTGSPSSGNLAKFSGATSITNGDLAGDCTTSGTLTTTCTKTNGTAFGTFATQNYATPPAIGGTTPAAGSFTTLSATGNLTTNVTGSTQCLHANSSGVVSGTGSDCGSSGSTGQHEYEAFGAVPSASSFTGVSNSASSLTDGTLSLYMSWTASGSNTLEVWKKSAPSTPYTVYLRSRATVTTADDQMGLVIRNSSNGKLVAFGINYPGTLSAQEWTNTTTFSSNLTTSQLGKAWSNYPPWYAINNDGTTLTFKISWDGVSFFTIGTRTISTFLGTGDEIGIYCDCEHAGAAWIGSFGTSAPS